MFKTLDNALGKILNAVLGLLMICMTGLVVIQVLARYVFHISLGGAEELPIYMLVCVVWIGAVCNARANSHIKVDLFGLFCRNEKVKQIVSCITSLITIAFISVFTVTAFRYIAKSRTSMDFTSGMHIPLWILHSIIAVCLILMAIYYLVHLIEKVKEVIKTCKS